MNVKISLLVLGAVLLIVSQVMGEGSAISSLASTDEAQLQQAMERGEAALDEAVTPTIARTSRRPAALQPQSLDDFYGGSEGNDLSPEAEGEGEGEGEEPVIAGSFAAMPSSVGNIQPTPDYSQPRGPSFDALQEYSGSGKFDPRGTGGR